MKRAFAILAVLCGLAVAPASAGATSLHPESAFSPLDGSGIGVTFKLPRGVGVDESSGNLLLTSGQGTNFVGIMNSEGGPPVGLKSPFTLGGFKFEAEFPSIAVDNSPTSPNRGTVYVSDPKNQVVKTFSRNAGTEQYEAGTALTPPPGVFGPTGIAIDQAGNVYVAFAGEFNGNGSIVKFDPAGIQLAQIKVSPADPTPTGLALGADGDLFMLTSDRRLFVYPANGLGEIEEGNFAAVPTAAQVAGIAVDRASDTLYAASRIEVTELDASSLLEKGALALAGPEGAQGIGLSESGGLIYVATSPDSGARGARAFSLNGASVPDVGVTDPPEPLKATRATLRGSVGPDGLEVSECKFEYGTTRTLGSSVPCEGAIPTDSTRHPVTAEITGLDPNRSYEYRLVAKNANGTSTSAIWRFRTKGTAETAAATAVGTEGATLNAVVRPEGAPLTDCKFEYGLHETFVINEEYEATLPCSPAPGAIPADFEPHAVSAAATGLLVGTTYDYRIVASGGLGTEDGRDQTVTLVGPSVNGRSFSALAETSVTLEALINPRGSATSFHFEYGSQGPCSSNPCTSSPVPDATVGSGSSNVAVSRAVKGLAPATTYHYRVIVSSADGTGHSTESTFTTYSPPPSFEACPNDGFRLGHPSAALPDCRAYEQATPVDKNGGDVGGDIFKLQASLSGDGITSQTNSGLPGGDGTQDFPPSLSQRGGSGWSTQGLLPPPSYGEEAQILGLTPDLAYSLLGVKLVGSDADGDPDRALLLRSSATRAIQQITPYVNAAKYAFAGASADDSKIFFEATGPGVDLTGGAATGKDNLYLYEPASEELSLVGVLPSAQGGFAPPGGSFAGPFNWWGHASPTYLDEGGARNGEDNLGNGYFTQAMHAISAAGDRAFFTAGGTAQVYVREGLGGEEPETAQVSASQRTTPDPNGQKPATFMAATPSGSIAFFTSCQKLTDDATARSTAANRCDTVSQGQDLYAYDTGSHLLRDLTVDTEAGDPNGADVKGVIGTSDDGSHVYFVANGDLDGAGPAQAGDCRRSTAGGGNLDYSGTCNLYLWHADSATFIAKTAKLDPAQEEGISDATNWQPAATTAGGGKFESTARVSADGQTIVFRSFRQLTAYDTRTSGGKECAGGTPTCVEYYRYQVGDSAPTCVTCNPTGAPPVGSAAQLSIRPPRLGNQGQPALKHFVSADGDRVFFETPDKLAAADTNGDAGCPGVGDQTFLACQDVYEWEAPGTGSCSEASSAYSSQDHGCLYLLSGGTGLGPSFLADASASGNDVFILTRNQLVPQDQDQQLDLYDLSVGGGLASQNQPPPPPPCEAGTCRGAGSPVPSATSPGTAGFQGPGNPQAKRHKKHKHRKHHHKPKHGGRK